MASQMSQVLPALAFAGIASFAITFAFAGVSQPSQQHLLAQSVSENDHKLKPRLTKHPSGAFVPRAVPDS